MKRKLCLLAIPLLLCSCSLNTHENKLGHIQIETTKSNRLMSKVMLEEYKMSISDEMFTQGLSKYTSNKIDKISDGEFEVSNVHIDTKKPVRTRVYFVIDELTGSNKFDYKQIMKYTLVKTIPMTDDQKIEINSAIDDAFEVFLDNTVLPNTNLQKKIFLNNSKILSIHITKGYTLSESGVEIEYK